MFGEVLQQIAGLVKEAAQNETLFKDLATCFAKMRQELVEQGFSENDATNIVIAIAGKK